MLQADGKQTIEAAHHLCRVLLDTKQPAKAAELAAQVLVRAPADDPFLVPLKLDEADALYEQSERRLEAYRRYMSVALLHGRHALAPQALYNAAYGAMELELFTDADQMSVDFLQSYPQDRLVPDVRCVQAECQLRRDDTPKRRACTNVWWRNTRRTPQPANGDCVGLRPAACNRNSAGPRTCCAPKWKASRRPARRPKATFCWACALVSCSITGTPPSRWTRRLHSNRGCVRPARPSPA